MKIRDTYKHIYKQPELFEEDSLLDNAAVQRLFELEDIRYNPKPPEEDPYDKLIEASRQKILQDSLASNGCILDSSKLDYPYVDSTVGAGNELANLASLGKTIIEKLVDIFLIGKVKDVDEYNKEIINKSSTIEEVERRTLDSDTFNDIRTEISRRVRYFELGEEVVDV